MWGLRHRDPDVAVMAARRLGGCSDPQALDALRGVLDQPPDPYVTAAALRSLVRIGGADVWRGELERFAHRGPALLRRTALNLLGTL